MHKQARQNIRHSTSASGPRTRALCMHTLHALRCMPTHGPQSDDSTMSVATDGTTLPQLAFPLQSRRFLVMHRLHLWFFHHERCYILQASLPALLGSPRSASAVLWHFSWQAWNLLHRLCLETHRCMRARWRITRSEEATLAQYGEARSLATDLHLRRTPSCSSLILWLVFYVSGQSKLLLGNKHGLLAQARLRSLASFLARRLLANFRPIERRKTLA